MVAGLYVVAKVLLGLHLYHGVWSLFQTLGLQPPALQRLAAVVRRRRSPGSSSLGNVSFPLAVLLGLVR